LTKCSFALDEVVIKESYYTTTTTTTTTTSVYFYGAAVGYLADNLHNFVHAPIKRNYWLYRVSRAKTAEPIDD